MHMNDKLSEINVQLFTFANKEDVNKKFNITSRRIREIIEIINKNLNQNDDGMLTKKNLGQIACATCQKNLINIQGIPVDHHVWNGLPLPKTLSHDRIPIARFGQGFSKILNTLKEDDSRPNINHSAMANHVHDKRTLHQNQMNHHRSMTIP